MEILDRETLASAKYTEVVKLAKERDVYRRYATKAELIDKLMALQEAPVETLNDVSMPSFTESDDTESDGATHDVENASPDKSPASTKNEGSKGKLSSSHRPPLSINGRNIDMNSKKSSLNATRVTPQQVRRSLAGPARKSHRVKHQEDTKSSPQITGGQTIRQVTFDVDNKQIDVSIPKRSETSRKLRREGTYELDGSKTESDVTVTSKTRIRKLRREGTFEVEEKAVASDMVGNHQIRRDGTFEVDESKSNGPTNPRKGKLKREGTFDLPNDSPNMKAKVQPITKITRSSISHQQGRNSSKSPFVRQRVSIATPSSVKTIGKATNELSVPRRFITSRAKPAELASPFSGTKSKIPSLINDVQRKKAAVSAKKMSDATGGKPARGKKAPDFQAMHQKLFDKMESVVDSRQKVLDKANSMQKMQAIKRSPPKTKVVRKLLSPKIGKCKLQSPKIGKSNLQSPKIGKSNLQALKIGKSNLQSPKIGKSNLHSPRPIFPQSSVFSSHLVAIQRRPSVGSTIPGVTKLQSPQMRPGSKVTKTVTDGQTNPLVFTRTEPSRKEALKAAVMGKKPLRRNSPMSKAKHALQSVRLNKRFELQMKHRLAQQAD